MRFYFAEPYSSWQRGTNENFNGLARQYYPKNTKFEQLSQIEINRIEKELSQRPKKRLWYRSSKEEFNLFNKEGRICSLNSVKKNKNIKQIPSKPR
ncbi:MAG: IS30 family transposase [Saprospiraceae bacterium]|nr:IS30 family transposase [Saprospiraceae bacterium]